jgi:di/tricarboxylate transporter
VEDGRRVEVMPGPDVTLEPGDHLLVKTRPEDMVVLRGLQRLEVDLDSEVDPEVLESTRTGFAEAVLAPRSSLIGRTLRQVNFRGRFGLHVVAIVREGEVVQTNLRNEVLHFGDALLLYGSRRHRRALAREADLILLEAPEAEEPETRLASLALLLTAVALLPVLAGWLPVSVGVLVGAVLMVATGCLTADEAYRAVDWPTLVLVAGMLALGAALVDTGAADLMGLALLEGLGGLGPWVVMAVLALVTAVAGQIIPSSAAIVLMAPIAVTGAAQLGVSPQPLVMATAIAATSLVSPVAQPALALVMAPAGYRAEDYLRLGLPMTFLVLALTLIVTPLVFPF